MHGSARAVGEKQTKTKQKLMQKKKKDTVALPVAEIGTDLGPQSPGADILLLQSNRFQTHQFIHLCHSMWGWHSQEMSTNEKTNNQGMNLHNPARKGTVSILLYSLWIKESHSTSSQWYTRLSCHDRYGKAIVGTSHSPFINLARHCRGLWKKKPNKLPIENNTITWKAEKALSMYL